MVNIGQTLNGNRQALIKLHWFTIEFAVIQKANKRKAYGEGIISSFGETNQISKKECTILPFNLIEVINKYFDTDKLQEDYFLTETFHESQHAINQTFVLPFRKITF